MKKLTQSEKEMVKTALMYVYDTKIDRIRQNSNIMSEDEIQAVLKTANGYFDLTAKFE